MENSDIQSVVMVHIRSFPSFFLTSLGAGFLFRLYQGFLKDLNSICMVVVYEEQVRGFVVGNIRPASLFRNLLLSRGMILLLNAFRALIRRPLTVSQKLIYALRYRGERPDKIRDAALLSSIGVDPDFASKGIGSILIKAFCREAFARGSAAVYLTTDKYKNEPVNTFYYKNGFRLESTIEKSDGRIMNRYILYKDETNI